MSLLSCSKEDEKIHKIIATEAFHTIHLNAAFEVELVEQDTYGIEILGVEDFVNKTQFNIQDSTLSIKNDRKYKWTDPSNNTIKLLIKGKGIKALYANESCVIRSLNPITTREFGIVLASKANTADIWVENDVFYYWNNFPCGGKLSIRGNTSELKLWNFAIMSIDASALIAQYGIIENSSKGDCIVNISESMDYKIEGEGNIVLIGNADANDKGSSNSGILIRR